MVKKEPDEIKEQDIKDLKNLIESIQKQIKENHRLDEILELNRKFLGPLGEGMVLVKLFSFFKSSVKYKWYGGFKAEYDLILEKGIKKSIQIKSSAGEEDHYFTINIRGFAKKENLIKDANYDKFDYFDSVVTKFLENKKVDYWIFVWVKDKPSFFVLDKKDLIDVIKEEYRIFFKNPRHNIEKPGSDKNGVMSFRIHGKNRKILNNPYIKENFGKIKF